MQDKGHDMLHLFTSSPLLSVPYHRLPQPPPSEVNSNLLAVRCGIVCPNHVARRSSSILPTCMYCLCPRLRPTSVS